MNGKVIAIANMKGGVGKTATVIGLAEALAAGGGEVLVIDLDAQASASVVLAGDHLLASLIEQGRTIDGFLEDFLLKEKKISFSDCVRAHISDVTHGSRQLPISLLASSPALRRLELLLIYRLTNKRFDFDAIVERLVDLLRDELKRSRRKYDFILIDCAPGISALNEASIRIADLVIVPTIADFLSAFGLQAFCRSVIEREPNSSARTLRKPGKSPHVLITRRRLVKQQNSTADKIRNERLSDQPSFKVFETEVPETVAIAMALEKTGTCPSFANKWTPGVVTVLDGLVSEIEEALHATRS